MRFILGEFFQTIFNINSKVFRSLRFLIFKPGFLTKEYVAGRRVSYLPPIRIYIVLSFFFFFLISVVDFKDETDSTSDIKTSTISNEASVNEGIEFTLNGEELVIPVDDIKRMQYEGTLEQGLDSLTAEMPGFEGYVSRKLAMAEIDRKGFVDVLRDQFSLFLMLFLPFFALLYATVFSRTKRGFVGHLIFNLHLNSFIIFALLFDLTFGSIIGNNEVVTFLWGAINLLYIQYYIIKAIMVFYERKWWAALYKYIFLLFGYGVLALVFLIIVVFSSIIML